MKFSLLLALGLLATALTAPAAQAAGNIDCDLRYNLSGWSLFYKTASGHRRWPDRWQIEDRRRQGPLHRRLFAGRPARQVRGAGGARRRDPLRWCRGDDQGRRVAGAGR
ncbi:hypothetical protein G6F31_013896 [Rhizopus arrhizus]|nr:hypothetical protein G6F31_013896 [Rhizopus arrhizus]